MDRLVWDLRKVREESPEASILVRETQAAAMRVVWGLQAGGHDLLTRCRALGEMVRALRSLGLLWPGGMARRRPVPMRGRSLMVPPTRDNSQEQDGGTEPEDEGIDDSAA